MDMEFEFFNNIFSEEYTLQVDANYVEALGAEGERCGICMDIVIDRGDLDCCQHWFCFVCIDNWASIANLCPLCHNEFQLITCLPVFDTVDSGKNDEDLDSRDDDWCVGGMNNTLTFPSYYIDENAVTCLAGDDCKIRSGSMPFKETLILDTSVACDSCDIWYHVFCVGFNLEGTCVDSWLCPRCLTSETNQKADLKEMYRPRTNFDPCHLVDMSSGKASICGADAREAALVLSRIDSEVVADVPIVNCLSNRNFCREVEKSLLGINCSTDEMRKPLDQGMNSIQLETRVPFSKLSRTAIKSEPDDRESRLPRDLGQSLAPDLFANNLSGRNGFLHDASLDENFEVLRADIAPRLGEKRKHQWSSFQTNDEDEHHEGRLADPFSTNKLKVQQGARSTSLNDQQILAVLMTFRQSAS